MPFCTEMEKNSCGKEALVCLQEMGLCENTHGGGEGHGSLDCSTRTRDADWPDDILSGPRTVQESRSVSLALMASVQKRQGELS